jgi:aspartyl-tRNA(Asn)/glutamyl-tRNA(Gln) amidotransferase subunit A
MTKVDPFATIAALGAAFRSDDLRPLDVTNACLARIEILDPTFNAFATVVPDRARAAATRLGAELASGVDRGPLHGVPVVLKDLIDMAGVPTGFGSALAFEQHPTRSAALVDRLESAGAVILGKTNLLEFAYGAVHPLVGPTNNPWDPARTSGGSSGGSAAAVAAGMAFGAVGTDTGGSIRIPAAYCGIVGLKPSFGLVSPEGVQPLSWTLDHVGPMGRTSGDVLALLDVMADLAGPTDELPLARRRFGIIREHVEAPCIRPDIRLAFSTARERMAEAGASFVDLRLPELDGMAEGLVDILLPEAALIHRSRLAERPEAYAPQTRSQIEAGPGVSAMAYLRAQDYRQRLTQAMEEALAGLDALIAPAAPWVAPREDPAVDGEEGLAEMHCTGPANLCGLPSVSLFGGLAEAAMPMGLMLTGARDSDRRLLRIGMGIERVLPPGVPPLKARAR